MRRVLLGACVVCAHGAAILLPATEPVWEDLRGEMAGAVSSEAEDQEKRGLRGGHGAHGHSGMGHLDIEHPGIGHPGLLHPGLAYPDANHVHVVHVGHRPIDAGIGAGLLGAAAGFGLGALVSNGMGNHGPGGSYESALNIYYTEQFDPSVRSLPGAVADGATGHTFFSDEEVGSGVAEKKGSGALWEVVTLPPPAKQLRTTDGRSYDGSYSYSSYGSYYGSYGADEGDRSGSAPPLLVGEYEGGEEHVISRHLMSSVGAMTGFALVLLMAAGVATARLLSGRRGSGERRGAWADGNRQRAPAVLV